MRHLSGVVWLGFFIQVCLTLISRPDTWVTIFVIVGTMILSMLRSGPRFSFTGQAMGLGLVLALLTFTARLVASGQANGKAVLVIPQFSLGSGAEFGGVITAKTMLATATSSAVVFAIFVMAGLLVQACPSGEYADIVDWLFGSAAELCYPWLFAADAYAQSRNANPPAGAQLRAQWQGANPGQTSRRTMNLAIVVFWLIVVLSVLYFSFFGGLRIHGMSTPITGGQMLAVLALLWLTVRSFRRPSRVRVDVLDAIVLWLALLPLGLPDNLLFVGEILAFSAVALGQIAFASGKVRRAEI
ncbi:hypothetical protein O6R08_10340 [Cutibacterium equinum]|uniref:Uncharacterized protein n=1 Tax=Cutibacterium equinum TaxID=3016342 RepID=A0ABY7QXS3_9ACTN|nr:hypothetical protein [Cutibacterium equinum]WCC79843.1 hypothetical protein O6R08_10340 [Cutibacterium equinum]